MLGDPVGFVDPLGLGAGQLFKKPTIGGGKAGYVPQAGGRYIWTTKDGAINPSKSIIPNRPIKERKMSDKELCNFFGDKNWHEKGYKKDYLKDFRKDLKGDRNPDFYYDKFDNSLWLRGTRDNSLWINTGDKI